MSDEIMKMYDMGNDVSYIFTADNDLLIGHEDTRLFLSERTDSDFKNILYYSTLLPIDLL